MPNGTLDTVSMYSSVVDDEEAGVVVERSTTCRRSKQPGHKLLRALVHAASKYVSNVLTTHETERVCVCA